MKFNISDYRNSLGGQLFGKNIEYINQVKSTNDEMWSRIIDENGLIIITDEQTEGRGRRSNDWFTKKYESLSFSIGIINQNINLLSQKIAIAIAEAIGDICDLSPKIKWPNDILINNKKIGGILIEKKNKITNIGIGLNVNIPYSEFPIKLRNKMTSLLVENSQKISREKLLSQIIKTIDHNLILDNESIIEKWDSLCAHNNINIQFHNNNIILKGIFVGINKTGQAIIKERNGINYYSTGIIEL